MTIGRSARAQSPSIGPNIYHSNIMLKSGASPRAKTSPKPTPTQVYTNAPGIMPKKVVKTKFLNFTPTSAGSKLATKKGTAGTSLRRNSTLISFSRKPSLNFCTVPVPVSIFRDRNSPSPMRAATNIMVAPMVAASTLYSVPGKSPNKNPPVRDAIAAPGNENATIMI